MKRAHSLKKSIGYKSFSEALRYSWLIAKNEMREREQDARKEAIHSQWKIEAEANKKAEMEAENARFEASSFDSHTYTMANYYNNYGYKGD